MIVPHQANFKQRLLAGGLASLMKGMDRTLRFSWEDRSGLLNDKREESIIFCIWHSRLALCMAIYRHFVRKADPTRKLAALISASRDGAFLAEVLCRFEVQPVRGSTSRRGPQSLLECARWMRQRHDVAITPDGPRGPANQVQEGIIALARVTGCPILPVACILSRKKELNSWDRFQVPYPFSRCTVIFDEPFRVPSTVGKRDIADWCAKLEERMQRLGSQDG